MTHDTTLLSPYLYSRLQSLSQCVKQINQQISQNFLQLTAEKKEAIVFGPFNVRLKKFLSTQDMEKLVCAFILSRLDYYLILYPYLMFTQLPSVSVISFCL